MLGAGAGRRWVASRWALRAVLGRYLGAPPAAIELELGEHGKPRLAGDAGHLAFNLSHSGELALVAVSGGPDVGVDLERIDVERDVMALAERALGAAEVAVVRAAPAPERAAAFYTAWARHEALVKCHGGGIWNPAEGEAAIESLDAGEGYAAAIAVAGGRALPRRQYAIAPA
jgi:4'-phosphopantetheinyl transferase